MTAQPDSVKIEAYISAAWVDLSDVWIRQYGLTAKWGMKNNRAIDIMAQSGYFKFTLNNTGNIYMPGLTTSLAGWGKNTPVRIRVTFEGVDYVRFRGYVDNLVSKDKLINDKRVQVTCIDYIKKMMRTPLTGVSVAEDKRADEGIVTSIGVMQVAPQATNYDTGIETFPLIHSSSTPRTTVFGEISKLVQSEFGYWYETHDKVNGETLRFESNQNRSGLKTLDQIQLSDGGALLLETGGYLLLQTGGKLLLNKTGDASFDNVAQSVEVQYGKHVVNYFKSTAYPTIKSGGEVQLWTKGDEPIEIGAGETVTIRGNYSDITGGNQIARGPGTTTTAYTFRDNPNGTGTNAAAYLTVTPVYDAIGVAMELTNTYSETGYVIILTFDAFSLTNYNPIFKETESETSKDAYDLQPQYIIQRYQQNPDYGILRGASIIETEKSPRLDLQKVNFVANKSAALMHAFLEVDIGSLVYLKHDPKEIDGYYYVQGVDFHVGEGDIINFSWLVREMKENLREGGLTPVAIEFSGTGTDDLVSYGRVPYIKNAKKRTVALWAYIAPTDGQVHSIFTTNGQAAGVLFANSSDKLYVKNFNLVTTDGLWIMNNVYSTNTWIHIAYTLDVSLSATQDPIIYVNGSPVPITETSTPAGAYVDEKGGLLSIGGHPDAVVGALLPYEGKMADVREYNQILSSAELTTLYNAGNPDSSLVTSGLVFQTFCVKTDKYSGLLNTTLSSVDKLIDNIYGIIGTPNDACVLRAFP